MIKLIAPKYPIHSSITLPGSKSISNRLLILRAVLNSKVKFENLSDSDDTLILAKALGKIQDSKSATIDIQHAGTDMRFLTAYLSVKEGEWILSGSDRMKQRPIGELVKALKAIGADISYLGQEGFPPLKIRGRKLEGRKIEIDGSISSQFISALLLIGTTFSNGLELVLKGEIVSRPYIKMTVELLKQFGIEVDHSESKISLHSNSTSNIQNSTFNVESDWSAASYWYSIIALSKGSQINLEFLTQKSLQADSVLPQIFNKLGVTTEFTVKGIKLTNKPLEATEFKYDFVDCPDIAQTLAATCVGLGIKAELNGLQTLKHKETDRIAALKTELEKFGAAIETTQNSITISPSAIRTPSSELQTYGDHRMAMSLAPLSLKVSELRIKDPEVVDKSYSAFWDDLELCGFDIS
jgi:3-phosphoshikimate 1-carboxyvinyltransferase